MGKIARVVATVDDRLLKAFHDPALDGLSDEAIKARFYSTLGVKPGDTFIDKVGDPTVIDDGLFTAMSGHTKLRNKGRHTYIHALAQAVADPDEIVLEYDQKAKRLLKKMLRFARGEHGADHAFIAIFEYLPNKTQGVSTYVVKGSGTVAKKRAGKLVYAREK